MLLIFVVRFRVIAKNS